jgi:renalase
VNGARGRVAVVGAGVAGAACARWLADAGLEVQVFDKSRGVGGRMATRRAAWAAADGTEHESRFDHGAPGFNAQSPEFLRFVEQARRDHLLTRWVPRMAPGSYTPLDDPALWVATPDMPALCRAMLTGLPVHTGCTVETLERGPAGWRLASGGKTVGEGFDTVILAIPPAQAAALLRPHRAEWAQRAEAWPMLPRWVLMAVTDDPAPSPDWDLAWPTSGPLAWVVRNDAKPGRERRPGLAHWVVHATAPWSQTHLASPSAEVQAALQAALASWLGRPLVWHHAAVHRWRYASVPRATHSGAPSLPATAGRCWWDSHAGVGVCGDALGGAGVEGAWCSARALATRVTSDRGTGHAVGGD